MSVLFVVCAMGVAGQVHAGDPPELFPTILVDPPVSPGGGRYLQTFTIGLDQEALRLPAQTLTLNLPGRDPEVVTLVHWEPRRGYLHIPDPNDPTGLGTITIPDPTAQPEDFWWRWYGKSANYTVALTVVQGRVAGRISSAAYRYAVEPTSFGLTRLGLVNSDYWQTHPGDNEKAQPESLSAARPVGDPPHLATPLLKPGHFPAVGGWDAQCTGPLPDGQYVIDVLFLYTGGILIRYGDHASVHAVVQCALDNANQALRNSGISNVVFSPRGLEFLPNPPPPDDYDVMEITPALHTVAGVVPIDDQPVYLFPGNPYVAGRRDAMWADIVVLARADQSGAGSCGVSYGNRVTTNNGYLTEPGPDFEKLAYVVFDPACDADRLNLAHELGHQLGMEHDPSNFAPHWQPGNFPSCPWSFGHKLGTGDPRFRFRTVMAYWQNYYGGPGGPPSCGSLENCPQIDAFSTPWLEWAGEPGSGPPPVGLQPVGTVPGASPIGIASAFHPQKPSNAVDTIRRIAPIVQAYRARPEMIFANGFQ